MTYLFRINFNNLRGISLRPSSVHIYRLYTKGGQTFIGREYIFPLRIDFPKTKIIFYFSLILDYGDKICQYKYIMSWSILKLSAIDCLATPCSKWFNVHNITANNIFYCLLFYIYRFSTNFNSILTIVKVVLLTMTYKHYFTSEWIIKVPRDWYVQKSQFT